MRSLLARAARLAPQAAELPYAHARMLCAAAAGGEPPSREPWRRDRSRASLPSLQQVAAQRAIRPDRPVDTQEHKQVEMNERIMQCATPDAVLALVTPILGTLGQWSVTVALQRIATTGKLHKKEVAAMQRDPRMEPLLLAAQWQLGSMGPEGLCGVLSACGLLGVKPPADWLQSFWKESGLRLGEFGPKELTTTLYAAGRLGLRPPGDWQNRFFRASAVAMPEYDPQSFANTLYACAQLGITPPHTWLAVFWPACTHALPSFKPQDFSGTLHACARMKLTPPVHTLDAFWAASHAKLQLCQPAILSKLFYGCAALRLAPPEDWMHAFWRKSTEVLRASDGQCHANVLESSAQLEAWSIDTQAIKQSFVPPPYWLDRYFGASADRMPSYVQQDFVTTLHALGRLGLTPPRDWLQQLWRCSGEMLPEFTPRSCATTLLACAQLGLSPPADWLQKFWRACERRLPLASAQDVSNTMYAVAVMALWRAPLLPQLWERLEASFAGRSAADWRPHDHLHALQMYHVHRAAETEAPGLLPPPTPELLAAARQSWLDQGQRKRPRAHHGLLSDVTACLANMGVAHTSESWCDRAERTIDIVIDGGDATAPRVALMVDNLGRTLRNGQLSGRTKLRNRTLAAHGWRVLTLASTEWHGLTSAELKEAYLRKLLARA